MSRSLVELIFLLLIFIPNIRTEEEKMFKSWDDLPRSFFCKTILCIFGHTHIACKYFDREMGKGCPPDTAVVQFTPELIEIILNKHNEKRDLIASGNQTNHLAACRMATMKWDKNLASYAELWAMQCKLKLDNCHSTRDFRFSGQNMAIGRYKGMPDFANLLSQIIESWFRGVENSDFKLIRKYRNLKNSPTTGQFTTMVNAKNIAVGCGAVTYYNSTLDGTNFMLMFCNYAHTNMVGNPVYRVCKTPASKCKNGTNPTFRHLCSENEYYAVNAKN